MVAGSSPAGPTKKERFLKAAQITGYRKIEITDIPDLGDLEEGHVRFKTDCVSVCGSDIHGAFDKVIP